MCFANKRAQSPRLNIPWHLELTSMFNGFGWQIVLHPQMCPLLFALRSINVYRPSSCTIEVCGFVAFEVCGFVAAEGCGFVAIEVCGFVAIEGCDFVAIEVWFRTEFEG
jgi:hypothetical protein